MTNSFAVYFGSLLLAMGVGSPALGRVNEHGATLVFLGLAMIVLALYADYKADKDRV